MNYSGIGQGVGNQGMAASYAEAGLGVAKERRPELACEMEKLSCGICNVEGCFNELVKRLDTVLRPSVPVTANAVGQQLMPAPPQTHYAGLANEMVGRANRLADRIRDAQRRLEV